MNNLQLFPVSPEIVSNAAKLIDTGFNDKIAYANRTIEEYKKFKKNQEEMKNHK